jgi:hypothetical protein
MLTNVMFNIITFVNIITEEKHVWCCASTPVSCGPAGTSGGAVT